MASVSIEQVIEKLKLINLTPQIDVASVKIHQPDINRPALQLAGYFEHFEETRPQIIGFVEYSYMKNLSDEKKGSLSKSYFREDALHYFLPEFAARRDF